VKEATESRVLLLTSERPSDSRWSTGTDATLVVNDLRDTDAIYDIIVCEGMAHASDIGLVRAVTLGCMVACHPSAVAADYEPLVLAWLGRRGCYR
jgi:hypothetical protein